MNPAMIIVLYGVIGVLVSMMIVVFFPKDCRVLQVEEGFQGSTAILMKSCPIGTKAYTDKAGNLNCCAGQVNGSVCEGNVQCTFSPSASSNIPLCSQSAFLYGPFDAGIGKAKEMPVQRIDKLGEKTLYSVQFNKYVVIVSSDNEARYYQGSIQSLVPSAFPTYNAIANGFYSLRML
jgi:hypothetical protein